MLIISRLYFVRTRFANLHLYGLILLIINALASALQAEAACL